MTGARRAATACGPAVEELLATATELPPHMVISLHGECSAQRDWPMIIMFWCDQPAATGGETPLADGRKVRVAAAIVDHPVTGEPVWFNHVETYHLASLPLAVVKRNLSLEDDVLPLEVSYGDGSPIDNETARLIRLALRAETVTFPWRRGDVLLLDNMLTAHGRRPFTGDRRVLVAMGNSYLDTLGRAQARPEADRRA